MTNAVCGKKLTQQVDTLVHLQAGFLIEAGSPRWRFYGRHLL